MAEIEFSDDPDLPLNQKADTILFGLSSLWTDEDRDRTRNICWEIYKMGFDDGQSWVWKMRQAVLIDDPGNPGKKKTVFPGDLDYPKFDGFITSITGGS